MTHNNDAGCGMNPVRTRTLFICITRDSEGRCCNPHDCFNGHRHTRYPLSKHSTPLDNALQWVPFYANVRNSDDDVTNFDGRTYSKARDLGPRVVTMLTGWGKASFNPGFWIYTAGPLVGAVAGGALYNVLLK